MMTIYYFKDEAVYNTYLCIKGKYHQVNKNISFLILKTSTDEDTLTRRFSFFSSREMRTNQNSVWFFSTITERIFRYFLCYCGENPLRIWYFCVFISFGRVNKRTKRIDDRIIVLWRTHCSVPAGGILFLIFFFFSCLGYKNI